MFDRVPRPAWILGLLAVFALGGALGVNTLIAKSMSVDPAKLAAARSGAAAPVAAATPGDDGAEADSGPDRASARSKRPKLLSWFQDPIVRRNLFDSANALAGISDNPKPSGDPDAEAQKSDLDAILISTSVAEDPTWSSAMLSVASASPEPYRIGDPLLTATILDIQSPRLDITGAHHAARVIVLRDGSREYIEAGGKPKAGARRKTKAKGKGKDDEEKPKRKSGRHRWDGIRENGDGKWIVEQGEIDYALGNLDKLSREARIVPNFADGVTNGFKVFSIRRSSALRKMGLKNNDVLTAVNGFDLSNTEKALEIYSKLQTDKSFSLEILRNGEPMTLEYSVQ